MPAITRVHLPAPWSLLMIVVGRQSVNNNLELALRPIARVHVSVVSETEPLRSRANRSRRSRRWFQGARDIFRVASRNCAIVQNARYVGTRIARLRAQAAPLGGQRLSSRARGRAALDEAFVSRERSFREIRGGSRSFSDISRDVMRLSCFRLSAIDQMASATPKRASTLRAFVDERNWTSAFADSAGSRSL